MTQVHFQRLNAPDRVEGIARLLLRRGRLHPHVLIYCPDVEMLERLDARLWTIHPESFLAHGIAGEDGEENREHPILLAENIVRDNHPQVLVNASLEVPPDISGFSHVVDFVDAWSPSLLRASRDRFRTYRKLGLEPKYISTP